MPTDRTKKNSMFSVLLIIGIIIFLLYAVFFSVPNWIHKAQLANKQVEIEKLTSQISDLRGDKKDLQAELENSVSKDSLLTLQTQLKNLQSQLDNLPDDPCAGLRAKIKDLEAKNQGLWGGINARDEKITKLTEKIILLITTTQVETRIISPFVEEDKVEILPGRNRTTINFELADGDCFINLKTGETFTLDEAEKKGQFYIYLLEDHYEKIEGTLNGNLLTFHIPNYEYTKFCIFVGKKGGKKELLWELTKSGGGSKFLYINGDQYCYYFQNDNGNVVSLGNQRS